MTTKKNASVLPLAQHMANLRGLYGQAKATPNGGARKGWRDNPKVPANWRDRLPDPATYYAAKLGKLTRANAQGFVQGRCPFHDDKAASLSVNVGDPRGGWKCFAGCGSGDLLAFHMRLTGQDFQAARAELLGVAR